MPSRKGDIEGGGVGGLAVGAAACGGLGCRAMRRLKDVVSFVGGFMVCDEIEHMTAAFIAEFGVVVEETREEGALAGLHLSTETLTGMFWLFMYVRVLPSLATMVYGPE